MVVEAAEASGLLAFDWFEHAAIRCAQNGIPIEAVHAAVAESVTSALGVYDKPKTGSTQVACSGIIHELFAVVDRAYG
ncbi:hypothetical protein [Nocardia sp. NPDC051832]|uniref:hypothetical protein n=1 Tax=Nocardia sp. NPDC051832 TaxID=3155673 RepID=UPI00342BBD5A